MRLTDLLALSHVPRWSIVPHSRPQSVADHTFRVIVILRELADRFGVELTADDYWYAVVHDGAESITGDIPGPFKHALMPDYDALTVRACPWLAEVNPGSTAVLLKVADYIECITFIDTWGVGAHAATVRSQLYNQLMAFCSRWPDVIKDKMEVAVVISEITQQRERARLE